MSLESRLRAVKKLFPLHNDSMCREIAQWSIDNKIRNIKDRIEKIDGWMKKIDKTKYDLSIDDLNQIHTRYIKRRDILASTGQRNDVVDRSLVSVYITDEAIGDNIYTSMCKRKTNSMIATVFENPEFRLGGTLEGCIRKCGGDVVAGQSRYATLSKAKGYSVRAERFLDQGHDLETANKMLSDRQRTFSLDICIAKHGETEGRRIWLERQTRWQETLNEKSDEEILLINKKKAHTVDSFMLSGMSYDDAVERVCSMRANTGYSNESILFFESYIPNNLLAKARWKNNEMFIYDHNTRRRYFFDLEINGVIIEYHGSAIHPNPDVLSETEWANWKHMYSGQTAEIVHEADKKKIQIAQYAGYPIFEVFSNDTKERKDDVMNQALAMMLSR